MATILSSNEFDEKVLKSDNAVLVDFFATWCGPCKRLSPTIDELSEDADFDVYKIDIDESGDIAEKYNIMSVPTMLVFKNGEVTNKAVGIRSKEEIIEMVNA